MMKHDPIKYPLYYCNDIMFHNGYFNGIASGVITAGIASANKGWLRIFQPMATSNDGNLSPMMIPSGKHKT
jgi:hypothetical protein